MEEPDTTQVTEETAPDDNPKGMRKQIEAQAAEIKELKAGRRAEAFDKAGFDTDKGLGKAIEKEYTGELTADAVKAYAVSEYSWEPPSTSENPQVGQIADEQGKLDQIGQAAGSIAEPTQGEVLAKAEAEGDYVTTMAIKGQQVADMMRDNRR